MFIEKPNNQPGLFDYLDRCRELSEIRRSLDEVDELIDWESIRGVLESHLEYGKTAVGRRAKDPVMMFKMLILQRYHDLSDDETEYQVKDRISFQRFLGLGMGDRVPDAKTLWLFKQSLGGKCVEELFNLFNQRLREKGFTSRAGKIVDATIIRVPTQRNSRRDNEKISKGERPAHFDDNANVGRQKDTDARWTHKHGKNHFGYKNHIKVDLGSKFIDSYEVTPANTHDSQVIDTLVADGDEMVFADAAYQGEPIVEQLENKGVIAVIHEKAQVGKPLTQEQKERNRQKSRIRCRVEHVFAWTKARGMGSLRCIGLARAKVVIGLDNLIYNMFRLATLVKVHSPARI
jgi:transposase, IS5 family